MFKKKIATLTVILTMIAGTTSLLGELNENETLKKDEIVVEKSDACFQLIGYRRFIDSIYFKYFNGCPTAVQAAACVTYTDGSSELKLASKIPENGWWSQRIFDKKFEKITNIDVVSSSGIIDVPTECESNEESKLNT